jgi:hypothetical protein
MGFFDFVSDIVDTVVGTVKAIIKNPVTAIAAVALAVYAPGLGLRLLGSMVLSSLLAPKPPGGGGSDGSQTPQQGTPQTLSPNTNNKLPAVYGKAFISPIIVDAKISTDNQTMWYVLALCEAPDIGESTFSIGDIYYDEKKVTYTSGTGAVTKLTNAAGQEDTKITDNMWMYFYNSSSTGINGTTGTAYDVMTNGDIATDARWSVNGQKMTKTIFMIVKLKYSTDDSVTGLGNFVVEINNNQNGITNGYKPGSAMLDYLTNDRYGANLSLDEVDTQSFYDLDTYSDEVITYTDQSGTGATQPRYRLNGVVDTSQSILSNLQSMAESCDSYISFNETTGKWSVVVNKSFLQAPNALSLIDDLFLLSDNNIIGGVNITPLDLNSTPNMAESTFYNYKSRGKQDFAYAKTPKRLKAFYEPDNKIQAKYNFVNDSVRAQYLTNRKLEQCRADYIVDLTCDYSAIHLDAGDVIRLTYEPHGGAIPAGISSIVGDGTTVTVTYNSTDTNPYHVGQTVVIEGVIPASYTHDGVQSSYNGAHIVTSVGLNTFTFTSELLDTPTNLSKAQVVSGLSWTNKPFRVLQIQEIRQDDGALLCKLQLSEYSEQVYDNWTIDDYAVPLNNYIVDTSVLGKPDAPTIVQATLQSSGNPPTFQVEGKTPSVGITVALEFWYSKTEAIGDANTYILYDVQYNSSKPQYTTNQTELVTVTGLEEGTYFWRVRAVGSDRKSEFSDSVSIDWKPVVVSNVGAASGALDKPAMNVVPFTNGQMSWPDATRGIMPAGGTTIIASADPGSVRVTFSSSVWANANVDMNCIEVWKSTSSEVFSKKVFCIRHTYFLDVSTVPHSRLSAVGLALDLFSDDGGDTWVTYSSSSTSGPIAAILPLADYRFVAQDLWPANIYGPYQARTSNTNLFANYGSRPFAAAAALSYTGIITEVYQVSAGNYSSRDVNTNINDAIYGPRTSGTHIDRYLPNSNNLASVKIIVTDNGGIYAKNGSNILDDTGYYKEKSNTLNNLYSVYSNYEDANDNFTAIAVGGFGTVLKSSRNMNVSIGTAMVNNPITWSGKDIFDLEGNKFLIHLYGVASDDAVELSTNKWVAVGERGAIISSLDNGETWTVREALNTDGSKITVTLRGIRHGNGRWVAAGENGVILTSDDTITWTRINKDYLVTNGWDTRHFYTVEHDILTNKFVVGGENIILNSSSTTTPDFVKRYVGSPDETYDMERLWYRGSHANARTTGTAVANTSQLLNGQTVSSTIIDTDYKKGDELGYYLVVGNIKGGATPPLVQAGGSVITATEYKK